jgi:hypothetical protein
MRDDNSGFPFKFRTPGATVLENRVNKRIPFIAGM